MQIENKNTLFQQDIYPNKSINNRNNNSSYNITNSNCEESFLTQVISPLFEKAMNSLPSKESTAGKVIEYTTGIYSFSDTFQNDLCDGQIQQGTAKAWTKVIGSSVALVAGVQVGLIVGGIGLAVSGPAGVLAGVGAGAAVAIGGGKLIRSGIDKVSDAFSEITQTLKSYIQSKRP